jgi:glucose dehydrogenase
MRFSPLTEINPTNVDRLQVVWVYHMGRKPFVAPTRGGGGAYSETPEGNTGPFHAFDAKTGKERWTFNRAAPRKAPMTYHGSDGRQYVVIASTGGGFFDNPVTDDCIMAFALDGAAAKRQ